VVSREGCTLVLEDTVLYLGGGGQPADSGAVDGIPVSEVARDDEDRIVHTLPRPLDAQTVHVTLDWARRYDYMQQHTAQHLLSAIAEDRFGAPTMSFHLGEDYAAIELDAASLPLDELCDQANAEIRAARPVRQRLVTPDELQRLEVRTRGLKAGLHEQIRLIEIESIDLNSCGGTHVASTAELQTIVFVKTEKIRGRMRLSYLAGDRLRRRLEGALLREQALTERLTCGPEAHLEQLDRLRDSLKAANKQNQQLAEQLADRLAEQLAADPESVVGLHREGADLPFLQRVASQLAQLRPACLMLLTGEGVFLLAGPEADVARAGPIVMTTLQGRGGGRAGRLQGKATQVEALPEALGQLREALA